MEYYKNLALRTLACAVSTLALAGCGLTPPPRAEEARGALRVADVAMAFGAPDLALRLANLDLEQHPGSVAAIRVRASALYALNAPAEAETAYRQLLLLDPADTAARLGLGRTLLRSDPVGAEAAFLAVLDREPANGPALNDLGIARDLQGRHQDAQQAYRQAMALESRDTDIATNLDMSLDLSRLGMNAVPLRQAMAPPPEVPAEPQRPIVFRIDRRDPPLTKVAAAQRAATPPAPDPGLAPDLAPGLEGAVARIDLPDVVPEPSQLHQPQQPDVATQSNPLPRAAASAPSVAPAPSAPSVAPAPSAASAEPDAPAEPPSAVLTPPPVPNAYHVQIAALDSPDRARAEWDRFRLKLPDLFANIAPDVRQAQVNNRIFWRLRTGQFDSYGDASAFCARLRQAGAQCWTPAARS